MIDVGLHGFASALGERERAAESIAGYEEICQAKGIGLGLAGMGCKAFRQMTGAVTPYVVRSIAGTLAASGVAASDVDHVVFSTMDKNLRHLDADFARDVLAQAGLVNCRPALFAMQQCASSLAAMDYALRLFTDPTTRHVLLVSFDYVLDDADRIQPFALFGDAVTSCLMSRATGLRVRSYAVGVDHSGLQGKDNFASRKQVIVSTMKRILDESGTTIEEVEKCFTTNLFKPIAWFNASLATIHRSKICIDTMPTVAHCGNCDWMLNLTHYLRAQPARAGTRFLVQAFAPGFMGGAILASM